MSGLRVGSLIGPGLPREKPGKQADQANSKMDEIEMEIEIEPDGTEVAEPEKTGDGQDRVDGSKDKTEEPCAVQAFAKSGK